MKNRIYKDFSRKVSYFLEREKKEKGKWKSFKNFFQFELLFLKIISREHSRERFFIFYTEKIFSYSLS